MLESKDIRRIVPHFALSHLCSAPVGAKRATLAFSALKHLKSAHFSAKNGCFSVFCGPHRHKNVCKHPFCVHLSLVSSYTSIIIGRIIGLRFVFFHRNSLSASFVTFLIFPQSVMCLSIQPSSACSTTWRASSIRTSDSLT